MSANQTVQKYISSVLSGQITTSKLVRLAIERHERDLTDGHLRNLRFDPSKGQHVITFVQQFCHHSQGKWAGQKVKLEPWQQTILHILYGWRWADTGYRRFKFAYIEMAKGNGKSFLCSALGLYELIASGEAGAEVYSVATTRDQAKIVFSEAERMVAASPTLKSRITSFRNNLHIAGTASKFQPLSSETGSLDGIRPQCFIVEELHRWSSGARDLWDVLANALGKRSSPLLLCITTSGSGEESLCRQQNRYSEKVLSGVHVDDSWFAFICGLDEDDDHNDSSVWVKANPNLRVSIDPKELAEALNKAKGDPASLNGVLRLRLGIWTSNHTAWMPIETWDACDVPLDRKSLEGQPCFAGLDLSTTTDVSAFVLLFPPYGDRLTWAVLPHLFLPEDNIEKRCKRDRVPYDVWKRQSLFELTPGNIIDYATIRAKIRELSDLYDIREIVFDPWNATETSTILTDEFGLQTVKMPPRDKHIAAAMKRLMELVVSGQIAHGKHPVLRWMAANVMAKVDADGHTFPDKSASTEKIDGITALILALTRAMLVPIAPKQSAGFLFTA